MPNTVTARLPKHIVKWMDELIDADLYKSRSEVIRDFLREYILNKSGK